MATTRLRKTLQYPTDSDHESDDELDEEHQERLIADLKAEDARSNRIYRAGFLCIPLLGGLFFVYSFSTASTIRQRLIASLSLSSLLCTGYILHFMPIEAPDRKGKRPVYQVDAGKTPVEKYLIWLNAALAGVLLLAAAVSWRKGVKQDAWREALPASESNRTLSHLHALTNVAVIFGLTMSVRQQLAPLDLEELQKAKYEYKGA